MVAFLAICFCGNKLLKLVNNLERENKGNHFHEGSKWKNDLLIIIKFGELLL